MGIILLDSRIENSHSGSLREEELSFLENSLEACKGKFLLIALHHPPLAIGSAWMDTMRLQNSDELFSLLDAGKMIKGVVWGHIHQAYGSKRGEILLHACPSTCIQFMPHSDSYMKDTSDPAYSIIDLYNDGTIDINIVRVDVSRV